MVEWLERLAAAPGPVALSALALASLLESGLVAAATDFLLILFIAGRPDQWLAATTIVIGASILGAAFGYWLGRGIGRPLIRRVLPATGRRWIEDLYRRHDVTTVGIGALLPFIPFKHISLTAGFFNLDFTRFIGASSIMRTVRFAVLGFAASRYHEEVWEALRQHGWTLVIAVLLCGAFVEVGRRRLAARGRGA